MNTALTTTGVHWTQFPADVLTNSHGRAVDWDDHQAAHRAVCSLFPARLPGDAEERRAASGILYRVDAVQGRAMVLVQSLVPPEVVPRDQRSIEVPGRAWDLTEGVLVAFRLAVNPVVRTTRHYTDSSKTEQTEWSNQAGNQGTARVKGARKQTARVVPPDEMSAWLGTKLETSLSNVEIVDHRRDTTGSGRHRLVIDTIDGTARVKDAAELDRLRRIGVGRSKAYGCGLLTVTRCAESR